MKKEEFLKNIISCQDPDMSKEALDFYKVFFQQYMGSDGKIKKSYRGDCMMSIGWTFGVRNKEGDFNKSCRSYTRLFSDEDTNLFYKFRGCYHSKANFIVIPHKLNIWRGELRYGDNDNEGFGSCDYFDIFLKLIRKYYLKNELLPRTMENILCTYINWLNDYGHGETGWKNFIEKNYLNPLVNINYEVKDIFAEHKIYRSEDCKEVVGAHHDFDWCLPRCDKTRNVIDNETARKRVVNFMQNTIWIWNERADILSKV